MYTGKLLSRVPAFLIGIFIATVFFIILYAAGFCQPNCEDLLLSLQSRDFGLQRSLTNMLVDFDGRYFINFLHAFNPLAINWIPGYKLMPAIGILLFVFSVLFFVTAILEKGQKVIVVFIVLFFCALYFALNPALNTSLYVMIGSFVYLWSWSIALLWMGACVRFISADTFWVQLVWFIASSFLLFCSVGTSEMFLGFNLATVMALLIWSYGANAFFKMLPMGVVVIISILFMVMCPGNIKRVSVNHLEGAQLIYYPNLIQSIFDYFRMSIQLLKNGILFFALVAAYPIVIKLKLKKGISEKINFSTTYLALFSLLLLLLSYLMTLTFYIPMQKESQIPLRVFSVIEMLQIISFSLLFYMLVNFVIRAASSRISLERVSLVFSFLLFFALCFSNNNITALVRDIRSGALEKFDAAMSKRYSQLYQAASSRKCFKSAVLAPIKFYPETIFYVSDIHPNRSYDNWNHALETYFKLDEVCLIGDTVRKYQPTDFLVAEPIISQ